MPISSLLLAVKEGSEPEVAERLAQIPRLDVHRAEAGQIIVVTDTSELGEDRALCASLADVPGVLAANVVFSNMEDCLDGPVPEE